MAVAKAPSQGAPRRRLSLTEKRRLVELSLREGSSIRAVGREYGVSRHTLYLWHSLYRAGRLFAESETEDRGLTSSATLLPVTNAGVCIVCSRIQPRGPCSVIVPGR